MHTYIIVTKIHLISTEDPSKYRPISILPIVSKVIEKHVTKHLFAYLNTLLHEAQSGDYRVTDEALLAETT